MFADKVSIYSKAELANKQGADLERMATDFALVNSNCFMYNKEQQNIVNYWLRNTDSILPQLFNVNTENSMPTDVNRAVCPVIFLPIPTIENNFLPKIQTTISKTGKVKKYIQLGEWPQNIVDDSLSETLEHMYNYGDTDADLIATGKFFTSNSKKYENDKFYSKHIPEFVFKGQKYVRFVSDKPFNSAGAPNLSNGAKIPSSGTPVWIKVEPIDFVIKNWEQMPFYINKKGDGSAKRIELESSRAIVSGIPYALSNKYDDCTWKDSILRAYLNSESLQNISVNKNAIKNNPNDFTKNGFLYEALNMKREAISEYTIPPAESEICRNSFNGCVALEKIIIPSHVKSIGRNAFDGCNFKFVYTDRSTKNLVIAKNLPKNKLEYENPIELEKIFKVVSNFHYERVLIDNTFYHVNELAKVLNKVGISMPYEYIVTLARHRKLQDFYLNSNFKHFKNEAIVQRFLRNKCLVISNDKICFYNFINALGCFSNKKMLDDKGRETNIMLAQKANTFLANILKDNLLKEGDFGRLFEKLPFNLEPNQNFLNFLMIKGDDKKYNNLQLIINLDEEYPGLFAKMFKDFDIAKSMRTTLDVNGKTKVIPWKDAIVKCYVQNVYENVTAENKDIADLFMHKGLSQNVFDMASEIRSTSAKNKMPANLLEKSLKEETILDSIQYIKNQTNMQLEEIKFMLDGLWEQEFTYELLDKYDPHNAILGVFCDCCANIDGEFYGKQIALASMKESDVQNIVVKDAKGEIIAKGAMYLNKKDGYAIINEFEVNYKYRKHNDDIFSDTKQAKQKQKIFDAFMRAINAFVKEYDIQNPKNPLKQVNVGLGVNKLAEQCKQYLKCTKKLEVPASYGFLDTLNDQVVLYKRNTNTHVDNLTK